MSEVKHTPGPWECGGEATICLTFDREANIFPPPHELTGGYQYGGPVAVVAISGDTGGMANAHLIAAAPDLLEACRGALECLDTYRERSEYADRVCRRLEAAIAKAEPADLATEGVA